VRVLLPILQFPPDVNATGRLMAQVGEDLVARGHSVSVVTTFPHYEKFRVWDEYRGKLAQREGYRGMDVLRLYVHASGRKQRLADRLMSYLSFNALATAAGLLSRASFDVILCPNGSFFSGLSSAAIGAAKKTPYVYNVQDLYPETPVRTGHLRNRHVIRSLEQIERFMYTRAAHVSVITESFRDHILSKVAGMAPEKVSVVPNFVDTTFVRPLPKRNAFSERYGLADRFVVTHAGNLGYAYDLDTLIAAAGLLRSEPDVLFLLVGDGVAKSRLERKVAELGLDNVRFLPFQAHADLPLLRASSDVQVALYRPGSASHSMPSKVYEIMASGRPVLAAADEHSDLWNLVEDAGCGVCVTPEDPHALADAVRQLRADGDRGQAMGARGRMVAERLYARPVVVDRYAELLHNVARGGRRAA
jgi:putative colanic acid biosynthesis glycosyltransferase WcaI